MNRKKKKTRPTNHARADPPTPQSYLRLEKRMIIILQNKNTAGKTKCLTFTASLPHSYFKGTFYAWKFLLDQMLLPVRSNTLYED